MFLKFLESLLFYWMKGQNMEQKYSSTLTFQRLKQKIMFKMHLSSPQQDQLQIDLLHLESQKQYRLQINRSTIDNDQKLSKCFEQLQDLYQQMVDNFEAVMIQDGLIYLDMKIGKRKKVRIELEAKPVEKISESMSDPNSVMIKIMQQEEKAQQTINKLSQKAILLRKNLSNNSEYMTKIRQEIQFLGEMLQLQKKEHLFMKAEVDNLEQQLHNKNKQKRKVNKKAIISEPKRNKNKTKVEKQNIVPSSLSQEYFGIGDFINQQIKKKPFQIEQKSLKPAEIIKIWKLKPTKKHQGNSNFELLKDNEIIRKRTYHPAWQNFICNAMLRSGSIYTIAIQILKTAQGSILIGVISKQLFNSFNTRGLEQCVSFDMQNPAIWGNRVMIRQCETEEFKVGDCVKMVVDLFSNKIQWHKKLKEKIQYEHIGQIDVPQALQQQKFLYTAITMRHYDDAIKVLP